MEQTGTANNLPSASINWSDSKVIQTIKRTVAQGATDEEFAIFAELCRSTGLNPFKREAWFIKTNNRAQIMTGLNGYLAIANRHPQFDGMEIEYLWDGQTLRAAVCKVYRKDRKFPSTATALMSEWRKETPIWKQMPSVMLAKVAKSIAIREAFALELAGTYTEEEMPPQYSSSSVPTSVAEHVKAADDMISQSVWEYDIRGLAEDKQPEAWDYLESNGAEFDKDSGLWKSSKRLSKLSKYELK